MDAIVGLRIGRDNASGLAFRPRWALAAALAVVAALAGCGARPQAPAPASAASGPAEVTSGGGFVVGGPAVQAYAGRGRTLPGPVTGELLDGSSFDLASLRGTVVVINWWGSWCEPCRWETPHLVQTYHATRALGVAFLGVDVRDSRDAASAFVADFQVPYPSLFDPAGRVALAFTQVPPSVVPTTVILDRSGRVAVAFRKVIDRDGLEPAVRRVAAEPAPSAGG